MTNKEALEAVCGVSLPDNTLLKALLDQGVDPVGQYQVSGLKQIDLAAIDVLRTLLSTPNVSEGGYSVSYDRGAVERRLSALCKKHNQEENVQPRISDVSHLW